MAAFPAGARAGLCFHEIFERVDFADRGAEGLRALAAECLERYGFGPEWLDTVTRAVRNTLDTALEEGPSSIRLAAVPRRDRISELEFYFPLRPFDHAGLRRVYAAFPGVPGGDLVDRSLERMGFSVAGGFLKGFIDLVFRAGGRYYLLDWKSNLLGATYDRYHRGELERIVAESGYSLQYHLYAVALHRWLGLRVSGYRYDRDFGGVFYLFFRGMDPERGPAYGVFRDRPDPDLVRALDRLMAPGPRTPGEG
jgi:exodeoxyribonuclease V beta subunit